MVLGVVNNFFKGYAPSVLIKGAEFAEAGCCCLVEAVGVAFIGWFEVQSAQTSCFGRSKPAKFRAFKHRHPTETNMYVFCWFLRLKLPRILYPLKRSLLLFKFLFELKQIRIAYLAHVVNQPHLSLVFNV